MKYITKTTIYLCKACDENPVLTTVLIFLGMIFFNAFEALIEKLTFGERFEHWLDPLFMGCFIAWAAYAVYICASIKIAKDRDS